MEKTKKDENKKSYKGLIITSFIILIIIIFALVGYILFDLNNDDKKDKDIKLVEPDVPVEKYEVTDDIKVQIRKNFSVIIKDFFVPTYSKIDASSDYISIVHYGVNNELFTNLSISEDLKKYMAIGTSEKYNYLEYSNAIHKTIGADIGDISDALVVKASDAENTYYNLFGKKITINENLDLKQCPGYKYDSENKMYYGFARCGGAGAANIQFLLTNYQRPVNDTITVIVYAAIVGPDGFIDFDKNIIEKDIDSKNFVLNESNKDKFDSYVLTYKLNDNGIFYFQKIEKN